MTTYRGDSFGKKLSRAMVWLHAATTSTAFGGDLEGALVLAGHGGDLATASGFGIAPSKLHAVDVCKEAVDFCSELYPRANVHLGRAGDVAEREEVRFNFAHLDFCGGLTAENIESCFRTALAMDIGHMTGGLYVTMMRGREPKVQPSRLRVALPRPTRRRLLKESLKGPWTPTPGTQLLRNPAEFSTQLLLKRTEEILRQANAKSKGAVPVYLADAFDGRMMFSNFEHPLDKDRQKEWRFFGPRSGKPTSLGTLVVRAAALGFALETLLAPHGRSVVLTMCVGYHSVGLGSGGTPFLTTGFRVCRRDQGIQVCRYIEQNLPSKGWPAPLVDILDAEASKTSIRGLALSFRPALSLERVAGIFDLPVSTVREWQDEGARPTKGLMGSREIEHLHYHKDLNGMVLRSGPSRIKRSNPGWGELSGYTIEEDE